MSAGSCGTCGAPATSALCQNHTARLAAVLAELAAGPPDQRGHSTTGLVTDLDVRLAKQDRLGPQQPTGRVRQARSESLLIDCDASAVAGDVARVVRGWAVRAGIRPEFARTVPTARLIGVVAARASRLAQHRDAADVLAAALAVRRRIVAAVDQRSGRRRIGTDQAIADRLDQADDATVTFNLAAEWALLASGRRLARGTFDSWVRRGKLRALRDSTGADLRRNGLRLFRWGDVRVLLEAARRETGSIDTD